MKLLAPLSALAAALLMGACSDKPSPDEDGVIRRQGQADVIQDFDAARMEAAISEAKSNLSQFIGALSDPQPGQKDFAIKHGFKVPGSGREYLWITEPTFGSDGFTGLVNNDPIHLEDLSMGQEVTIPRDEVADWLYDDNGQLQGGYTIAALVYGSPEQDAYADAMGIDWNAYEFLELETESAQ